MKITFISNWLPIETSYWLKGSITTLPNQDESHLIELAQKLNDNKKKQMSIEKQNNRTIKIRKHVHKGPVIKGHQT